MPKYFSLRKAVHELSVAIPTEEDPAGFEIEDWITAQWRNGSLKITGRPWANAYRGDRTEIEPHSDRDISWHEGVGFDEPRIYERESPGRGAVSGQWRGLEITADDLTRLLEYIQGLPESQNAPVTLAGAPHAPVSTELPDQPGPKPGNKTPLKALVIPIALAILKAPDRPPEKHGWRVVLARRIRPVLQARELSYELSSITRELRKNKDKVVHPDAKVKPRRPKYGRG